MFALTFPSFFFLYKLQQVLEYDTPEELLQNEGSSFSKMVQSTGAANAEYLRGLVLGGERKSEREESKRLEGQRKWLVSSRWASAAQFALAVSLTSSQNDLVQLEIEDDDNILKRTKDAVITLQGVLEGKHDKVIEETLERYQAPRERWWSALYKMVEGNELKSIWITVTSINSARVLNKFRICIWGLTSWLAHFQLNFVLIPLCHDLVRLVRYYPIWAQVTVLLFPKRLVY